MIVRFKKVTKTGKDRYTIETNMGVMYYRGLMHENLEGKDVDVAVEEELNIKAGGRKTLIVDYKCEITAETVPAVLPNSTKKEQKKQEVLQKTQQHRELEAAFLRDILVSPMLASAKGDPIKNAQKWAKAHAKWILREGK